MGGGILSHRWSGKVSQKRWYLSKDPKKVRKKPCGIWVESFRQTEGWAKVLGGSLLGVLEEQEGGQSGGG